ncbi:MAG TPA: sigma-54 dependent transcriptional regulator [Phycisphaerae bacterium]|nr:sigma-54 dependent transcriptional regulator [Phycisphaerae bacterium]
MSRLATILVVEDDAGMRESCAKLFELEGYSVCEASSGPEALEVLGRRGDVDIVLTDLKMPGMDGVALLKEIKRLDPGIEVVLMTGYGTVKNAVEAMMQGAADYITKPFDTNELLTTIGRIIQLGGLRKEVSQLRGELREKYRFDDIVGTSSRMWAVYERIEAARNTNSTVLICGESGTGKELVARAIHYSGLRNDGPFVPVNCAAMPRELIDSELFGHRKGSFTGAVRDAPGLFLAAEGGTLLLDEIVDMPYETQAKLLRALQEKRIRPVGGAEEVAVDVRVIASTNQDIDEAIRDSRFREDLYYRLAVIRIELPLLRERAKDIPDLVRHFIEKFNKVSRRQVRDISQEALDVLERYRWPGNVRELESVIENTFALGKCDAIQKGDLPAHLLRETEAERQRQRAGEDGIPTLLEAERRLLLEAMKSADGNKTRAAEILGVSRPRLYKMLDRHGING